MDLEKSTIYYDAEEVPEPGYYYMPVQCQHCANPPCTKVCPVQATWTEPDGIVVVDYNWCIGCRYCMAACPYMGRFQLHRPRAAQGQAEYADALPGEPPKDAQRGGEMHLLHPEGAGGEIPQVRGGVPCGGS
jgi:Fe-S-cluster-containing hydrogenase component 2